MYQPKIREELIRRLYQLAKARKVPMTRLVNQLLTEGIGQLEQTAESVSEAPGAAYSRTKCYRGTP